MEFLHDNAELSCIRSLPEGAALARQFKCTIYRLEMGQIEAEVLSMRLDHHYAPQTLTIAIPGFPQICGEISQT